MRAVQLDKYGSAENLRIVDLPVPRPTENQILIGAEATGLIFANILMRRAEHINQPAALPFVPGWEVAVATGSLGSWGGRRSRVATEVALTGAAAGKQGRGLPSQALDVDSGVGVGRSGQGEGVRAKRQARRAGPVTVRMT